MAETKLREWMTAESAPLDCNIISDILCVRVFVPTSLNVGDFVAEFNKETVTACSEENPNAVHNS